MGIVQINDHFLSFVYKPIYLYIVCYSTVKQSTITEVFSTVPREKAVHTPLTACRSVCYNDFSRLTNQFLELYYPFFLNVYISHFSRLQKRLLPKSIISRFTAFLEIC